MIKNLKLAVTIVLALALLISNCSESPTDRTISVEPDGYKVYFYDNGDNPKWYTYYPEEDILDSVYLPMRDGWRQVISPAGDRMYIERGYGVGCEVVVVDLIEKTKLSDLTGMCGSVWIKFSPDNSRMLVDAYQLNILDYETHEVLLTDSTPTLWRPVFSADADFIYGTERNGYECYFSVYDAHDLSLVSRDSLLSDTLNIMVGETYTTEDRSTWYILGMTTEPVYLFLEWNAETDSILFIDSVQYSNPNPVMLISNDNRYVVYNNPGYSWRDPETQPCEIKVYDRQLHQLADIIDTRYVDSDGDTTYYAVTEMAITPDSKYLVAISHGDESLLLVYNLETLEIERWVELPGNHSFRALLCQKDL